MQRARLNLNGIELHQIEAANPETATRLVLRAARSPGCFSGQGRRAPEVTGVTAAEPAPTLTVLVFSHRPEVRESITTAVGRRPAPDLPRVRFREVGTIAEVLAAVDAGEVDLAILDGEAQPTGGIGLARQLKDEIEDCPPMIIAVRRRDDQWLARWSQAEAVLMHPLDPLTVAETVADVLRRTTGP